MSDVGLEDLYEEIRQDSDFAHLRRGQNRLVPGEGNPDEPIAFILGEAPGAAEAMQLRPFVGPAGKVLRELMESAELFATSQWSHGSDKFPDTTGEVPPNVWLTNVLKYRPPSNRTPTEFEIKKARRYVKEEWILVGKPDVIIPVGGVALTCVMGKPQSILRVAGRPMHVPSRETMGDPFARPLTVWPMIHPAYALRNEQIRPTVETHWEQLGEWLRKNDYY